MRQTIVPLFAFVLLGAGVAFAAAPDKDALKCPKDTVQKASIMPCKPGDDCDSAHKTLWCARPDGMRHGPQRSWFDHGERKTPRSTGQYKDGRKEGKWTWWYRNGKRRSVGAYEGDQRTGAWTIWYDNGQKNEAGRFAKDVPEGQWSTWHDNGKLASKGKWAAGKRTGAWTFWDVEGKVEAKGSFGPKGHRHGKWSIKAGSGALETVCYEHARKIACAAPKKEANKPR